MIKLDVNNHSASGKPLEQLTITSQDGDNHRYSRADRQSDYNETIANYHDDAKGKTKHISVKHGKAQPVEITPTNKAHVLIKPTKDKD